MAIHDDIKVLRNLGEFKPAGFVELQDHAKEMGIQNFSLKKLTAIACGFRISKRQQLSNWEADNLTEAQQIYAATDAWAALEIYLKFFKQLKWQELYKNSLEIRERSVVKTVSSLGFFRRNKKNIRRFG